MPWFDPEPLMDIALGGAIVAIREEFPDPNNINVSKAEQDVEALIEKVPRLLLHDPLNHWNSLAKCSMT